MNRTKDRGRHRRTFRLECLEERNLLSNVAHFTRFLVPSAHPPLPHTSVIKGTLHLNIASSGLYTSTPAGRTSYSGNGLASPANVGNLTFGLQQTETAHPGASVPTTDLSLGQAVLSDQYGEKAQISFSGQELLPRGRRHTVTITGTINSGTGRFENATGTFTATGSFVDPNSIALRFSLKPVYKTS